MKKGQISDFQLERFEWIDHFIEKKNRFPYHRELAKAFRIKLGGTTMETIQKYWAYRKVCPTCLRVY